MQESGSGRISETRRHWQDYDSIKVRVVSLLNEHPEGLTGARIAEEIGITQGAMSKYLSMLKVGGVILSRKVGVAKLWSPVSQADRAEMLAGRLEEESDVTFKDYAASVLEKDSTLFEADGKRVLVMPTMMLAHLYKYTRSVIGTEVHAFFYEWGREYANAVWQFVSDMADRTGVDSIQAFLLLWKLKGWGRFEVTAASQDSVEVAWHDSIWSEAGADDQLPVDDFVSGALSTAASLSLGEEWKFTEVECMALGAPACHFKGNKKVDLNINLNNTGAM